MTEIEAFIPPQVGDDEHIIRRLGWAVTRHWPDLPSEIKETIRSQAVMTEDRYTTVQLNEQINLFLKKYGG